MTSYEFGDVVLVDFYVTGSRERKRRPALVIIDTGDQDIVLAPITTHKRSGKGEVKIKEWHKSGLLRESFVRLAKVACFQKSDTKQRLGKLLDSDKVAVIQSWRELYSFYDQSKDTEKK